MCLSTELARNLSTCVRGCCECAGILNGTAYANRVCVYVSVGCPGTRRSLVTGLLATGLRVLYRYTGWAVHSAALLKKPRVVCMHRGGAVRRVCLAFRVAGKAAQQTDRAAGVKRRHRWDARAICTQLGSRGPQPALFASPIHARTHTHTRGTLRGPCGTRNLGDGTTLVVIGACFLPAAAIFSGGQPRLRG